MYGRSSEISLGRTYNAETAPGTMNRTTSAKAMEEASHHRPIHTNAAAATQAAISSHCSGRTMKLST